MGIPNSLVPLMQFCLFKPPLLSLPPTWSHVGVFSNRMCRVLCCRSHSNSSRCSRQSRKCASVCVCDWKGAFWCWDGRRSRGYRRNARYEACWKAHLWSVDGTVLVCCMHASPWICVCACLVPMQWRVTCFMSTTTCTVSTTWTRRTWR